MNHAGLPGTGLGGLFYLVLAFAMPLVELPRTLRGRSSRARWHRIGSQVALAGGIAMSVAGTAVVYLALLGSANPFGLRGPAFLLAPVVLAGVLLSGLVVVLRTWAGWLRYRAEA